MPFLYHSQKNAKLQDKIYNGVSHPENMLDKKELAYIVVASLIVGFAVSIRNLENVLQGIFFVFVIISANFAAKSVMARYFESEIEVKFWEMRQYGLMGALSGGAIHPSKYFKKPVPIGGIVPIITSVISLGYFAWMAALVFDIKAKVYRAAKRHGLYSFSEVSEEHMAYMAASGILINFALAILGYLLGFSEFAKLNIYYAFFNLIPISELDGNKIFFGEIVLWSFLASVSLVGLSYVFFIV